MPSIVLRNIHTNQCLTLIPGRTYNIGRQSNNEIQLPNDPSISRQHAKLSVQSNPMLVLLYDFSTYGTFVNRERIIKHAPHPLEEGSLLQFGTKFSYVYCLEMFQEIEIPAYSPKKVVADEYSPKKRSVTHHPTISSQNKSRLSLEFNDKELKNILSSPKARNKTGSQLVTTFGRRSASAKKERTLGSKKVLKRSISGLKQRPKSAKLSKPILSKKKKPINVTTSKTFISRIISKDVTPCGNTFYICTFSNGKKEPILKQILLANGHKYLIDEFEGHSANRAYREYYEDAVREYNKRKTYYQHKYGGLWLAIDNFGELIDYGASKKVLTESIVKLRKKKKLRRKYLSPFIVYIEK